MDGGFGFSSAVFEQAGFRLRSPFLLGFNFLRLRNGAWIQIQIRCLAAAIL
jgi:hypothetical protein